MEKAGENQLRRACGSDNRRPAGDRWYRQTRGAAVHGHGRPRQRQWNTSNTPGWPSAPSARWTSLPTWWATSTATEPLQFVVSNSKATRNGTLVLPSLACNGGLRVPQDSSMAVTSEAPPSDLLFFLAQPPQYCTLLRGGVPLTAGGSNFTQWDLQELEVTYRHGGGPSQIGLRHYQQGLPAGGEGTD
ncbi:FRAS1-related extracellular matrix protein 1 [Coregonus clupeaformis]|uniref:FRAS1-related extracellular matrix protein 1 n=1 Tax=Coregonus clupeaformis TaxID=59861 RepID=UPI001E1C7B9A|nr:FRAS1-related extracellular matrix protein 1 [Coregonus clupeaformis]